MVPRLNNTVASILCTLALICPLAARPAGASSLPELKRITDQILRASGEHVDVTFVPDADRSGGIAAVSALGRDATIFVNPWCLRRWSANTWAFIIGHELAHVILVHFTTSIENEWEADELGAKLARAAGFDLEDYVEFMLTQPNSCSPSHGCWHARARNLADTFNLPGTTASARHRGHRPPIGWPGSRPRGGGRDCTTRGRPCHCDPPCEIGVPTFIEVPCIHLVVEEIVFSDGTVAYEVYFEHDCDLIEGPIVYEPAPFCLRRK